MNRVNIKPLSVNGAWKGKKYATPAYTQYKRDLGFLLPKNVVIPEPPYQIHFIFGFSSVLSDGDNPIKPTQDCIAKKYGFNDKLIRKWIIETEIVPKGKEFFAFEISNLYQGCVKGETHFGFPDGKGAHIFPTIEKPELLSFIGIIDDNGNLKRTN